MKPLDTAGAITMIQGLITNAQTSMTALQGQIDGFTVVLNILQGIENTPSVDLQEAQQEVATLQSEVTTDTTQIDTLQQAQQSTDTLQATQSLN